MNDDGDPIDDNRHGTHVAGTVGAVGDNGVDIVGVAWDVQMMALKSFNAGGSGQTVDSIAALEYAIMMGADVSNNSYGGGAFNPAFLTAIQNANAIGHVFVAAAGNSSANSDLTAYYPQGYDVENVISVAALSLGGGLAGFSNYGVQTVDIAAPGTQTVSTGIGGGLLTLQGTSMASPHVAGVAALLKTIRPDASAEQIKAWILDGGDADPQLDGLIGSGARLNA